MNKDAFVNIQNMNEKKNVHLASYEHVVPLLKKLHILIKPKSVQQSKLEN